MNLITHTGILDFDQQGNILIFPVAKQLKKDGSIVILDSFREAVEKYPQLPVQWTICAAYGIEPWVFTSPAGAVFVGFPIKDHYASKNNPEYLEAYVSFLEEWDFNLYLQDFHGLEELLTDKYADGRLAIVKGSK